MEGFFAAFLLNLFAEFGDKTQLAVLALAAHYHGRRRAVLLGCLLGLGLAILLSVALGGFASGIVPQNVIKYGSAALFILFGAWTLFGKGDGSERHELGRGAFASSAALLFLMEMGDKTQLANVVLAARYHPLLVFAGAFLGEGLLTVLAVFLGNALSKRVEPGLVKKIAALLFIAIGLAMAVL